jgi:hypothetical protein
MFVENHECAGELRIPDLDQRHLLPFNQNNTFLQGLLQLAAESTKVIMGTSNRYRYTETETALPISACKIGTKVSRGRDTVFFLVSDRTTPARSFIRAAWVSSGVRSTGRRWEEGPGISSMFRQPLEWHAQFAELASDRGAHQPFFFFVGSEIQHAAFQECADCLPLRIRGSEVENFQALSVRNGPILIGRGYT